MANILTGFKTFIMRGNIVELAVAFVIGVAFAAVVNALVTDLVTPIIASIFGKPSFENLSFTINNSHFLYGDFINAVINFITIAAAIYFFVVVPMNYLTARARRGEVPPDPTTKICPECLSTVPIEAHRCAYCTSAIA